MFLERDGYCVDDVKQEKQDKDREIMIRFLLQIFLVVLIWVFQCSDRVGSLIGEMGVEDMEVEVVSIVKGNGSFFLSIQ